MAIELDMPSTRRRRPALWSIPAVLLGATLVLAPWATSNAADPAPVRVGALAFGTVNWELDAIRHHGLDRRHGIELTVVALGGKQGSAVALQGGTVDIIVTDWFWVSRRRADGADYSFVPHSLAVGGLMVRPDAGIGGLADLKGRKIGIAGGPVDKSWLLLRAYSKQSLGVDLAQMVEPSFAAPPLLNKLVLKGSLPAALNFWHYGARLQAAGMVQLISVEQMLPSFGVKGGVPLIGWVFSEDWAKRNPAAIDGFLRASLAAKRLLATSDAEWARIRKLTKAEDDVTFEALKAAYRAGIPASYGEQEIAAARVVFDTVGALGGPDLVGDSVTLTPGTFWDGFRF